MYVMKNGHIMMKLCVTLFFIGLMIVASSDSRSNEATMLSSESFRKDAENSKSNFSTPLFQFLVWIFPGATMGFHIIIKCFLTSSHRLQAILNYVSVIVSGNNF